MKIIYILEKERAEWLNAQGFPCQEKKIDDKTVYAFIETPEMMKHVAKCFSSQAYFMDPYLKL